MVRLGTSAVTLTLQRNSDGGWTEDGETVRNGDVRRVGNNRYRLLLEDGEWSAEYLRSPVPVDGAGGLIILFQEEDGTLTHNGDPVRDGSVITQDGRTYELMRLSDGSWLATPSAPPPASGDQTVSLPGGQTVTLRRTSSGTFTYNGNPVSSGSQITAGGSRYRLTQASDGRWSAATVRDPSTVDTGGVAGPTQTDEVDTFTDGRFDDDLTDDDTNTYGVQLSTLGEQPSEADDRGTKIVPQRTGTDPAGADHVEFPVYDLMQESLVTRERPYVEAAKAKLQEIVDIIRLNKELYARDARDPDDHIADVGTESAPGLWRQAEMAVGKIFGLTDFSAGAMEGILGGLVSAKMAVAEFRVQLVDDAVEALGVWEAFGLEGGFRATRTGTVSKPTLPREADRRGGATSGSIHYITNDTAGTGTGGPITPDTEESTFSLARDVLEIATDTGIISDEEFNRNFTGLELTDLYRRSRTARAGSTFVSEARTQISSLRTGLTDDNYSTRLTEAGTILNTVLGISGVTLAGDTRSAASTELSRAVSALGSAAALQRALADEGLFAASSTEFDTDEARQVYSEKRWDFKYDFGRNRYTRFGVWSQIAPDNAQGNVDGTDTDADSTPAHGSFAYSPLAPAVADNVSGLTFAATYEGRTLAVNESTGDLYAGQFILQVDWADDTPSVRTTITDLKGVRGTSAYFKYGTKDAKSIFFTGLTAAAGTLGGTPTMRVRYRDSSQDTTAASGITAAMAGVFVMDQDFRDEPVGVLGTWSITDTGTTVDDYSASFGAEVKP